MYGSLVGLSFLPMLVVGVGSVLLSTLDPLVDIRRCCCNTKAVLTISVGWGDRERGKECISNEREGLDFCR